jgi:hypothetical protein
MRLANNPSAFHTCDDGVCPRAFAGAFCQYDPGCHGNSTYQSPLRDALQPGDNPLVFERIGLFFCGNPVASEPTQGVLLVYIFRRIVDDIFIVRRFVSIP